MATTRKQVPRPSKKVMRMLGKAMQCIGDKPSMTLPVEQVLAMGLPHECKGGRILHDEELEGAEGGRVVEYEKDGTTYSLGYEPGEKPFAKQRFVDITIVGTFN